MDVYIVIREDSHPVYNKTIAKVFVREEDAISYVNEMMYMLSVNEYSNPHRSDFYYVKRHAI